MDLGDIWGWFWRTGGGLGAGGLITHAPPKVTVVPRRGRGILALMRKYANTPPRQRVNRVESMHAPQNEFWKHGHRR